MRGIDILPFCLSILGIYSLILYPCYLLPCNAIPFVSALLNETRRLLDCAEAIGAVPPQSECKTLLDHLGDKFAAMRMESNHARGTFQQLRLVLLHGLTYKVYSLYYQIEDIKAKLELVVDKQQLVIIESTTSAAVPSPPAAIATPVNSVIEMALPLLD